MHSDSRQPVLKVAIPVPLDRLYDYLPPRGTPWPAPGCRVRVRFGARTVVGLVAGSAPASEIESDRLQPLLEVLDGGEPVVSPECLGLLLWCARYYKHPVGEVVFNGLPPILRRRQGRLPPPPTLFELTGAGRDRLAEPPGRAIRQHAVLAALAHAPLDRADLESACPGAGRVLAALRSRGWLREISRPAPTADPQPGPELTAEQAGVLDTIRAAGSGFRCHLLDGVTGSGKTEIYLRLIRDVLERGRQALVLVPEIGLTPQLVRRFHRRLGVAPVVSHSGLADGERAAAWAAAQRGTAPLVLGTRSALFMPLARPGIIIMDESHDPSFKQQEGFRFSARDVAVKRAADLGIPVVLGTATPSLESLHNAMTGKYDWHRLRQRATGAEPPAWRVVDLRQQPAPGGLSPPAVELIEAALQRGEQVLVFLNRRGYAPVLLCHECGWHAACRRCDANLTWHQVGRKLVCHHCEAQQGVPRFCPECRADALQGAGEGTERLEGWLAERFPGTPVLRVDRDAVRRRGELESLFDRVRAGEACVLVGTQMLAKGHHFPRVTLVLVVGLDQALYSADFRALERMGQLLVQVAGRAGRDRHPGTVVLQTHHPDSPALETLIRSGYGEFAREQLEGRRLAGLPPFSYQALLRAEATDKSRVLAFLEGAAKAWDGAPVNLHGPLPAMMERRAGRYRWYLLAQDMHRGRLQAALDTWLPVVRELPTARAVRWTVDIDPQEF